MEITLAKKTSTIRVFELARELGVTSKDILAKCKAEGIPAITNHMSTISLGLAATVREWFGVTKKVEKRIMKMVELEIGRQIQRA